MSIGTDDSANLYVDGRHYVITKASDVSGRDGYGWELEDVAPSPGLGLVAEAFWDDTTGLFTYTAHTYRTLPFALVEHFVTEARKGVPPADVPALVDDDG